MRAASAPHCVRRHRTAVLATALTAALLGSGPPSPAQEPAADSPESVVVTAPFDAAADSSCSAPDLFRCEHAVTADPATGALSLLTRMEGLGDTPIGGVLLGEATAAASFSTHVTRAEPAGALFVVAHLTPGEISTVSEGVTAEKIATARNAAVRGDVVVTHDACDACTTRSSRTVSSAGVSNLQDIDPYSGTGPLALTAVMARPDGDPIPPGTLTVTVTLTAGFATTGVGRVAALASATLDGIEVTGPTNEPTIAPPYASANGERTCSGEAGTTFVCRSVASRLSGRAEMDLAAISPVAGTAPGSGDAWGTVSIVPRQEPANPVRARAFLLTLHVTSADAYAPPRSPLSDAGAFVTATVRPNGMSCRSCTTSVWRGLVASGDAYGMLDEDMVFVVTAAELEAASSKTPIDVATAIDGSAHLFRQAGTALASLRAQVASVRVLEFA